MLKTARKISNVDFPGQKELRTSLTKFSKVKYFSITSQNNKFSEFDSIITMFNIIFLLPFMSTNILLNSLKNSREEARNIYRTLGKIETSISLLNYQSTLNYYCKASKKNDKGVYTIELYHPLLENPISNDFNFKNNVVLSGDNTSGKSTFLKAIAVNIVIAQSLGFAFAKKFEFSPGNVYTTININDCLSRGESHFIAESKAILRMMNSIEANNTNNYLFLDEIFKGTNTIERISAGLSIIKWLSNKNCLYMISTHDVELVELAKVYNKNYHFESSYIDGEIVYDYLIKEGHSVTRNAISVLDSLNYPKEIIIDANTIVKEHFMNRLRI